MPSDDPSIDPSHPNDDTASSSAGKASPTPPPGRKSIGTDPTMPIFLHNVKEPKPVKAEPIEADAAADEEWSGSEQTLVGAPALKRDGSDRLPIVVTEDDSSNWLGAEKTALPASRPVANVNDEEWAGSEVTMVGAPVPSSVKPTAKNEDEWMGNDATIIGTPSPQAKSSTGQSGITTGGGKKTNSTMDDGWHLKGRQGPLTGQTIGDYEIGGILGEGGMGTVYRAKQISLKRRVAVKVLPPHLASNAQMRQRFEQEATTASLLNSPHVVQVFAAGSHNDMVYFVMEFVEGTDLSEKISEKHDAGQLFTPDEATNFIIQAARGLAEANKHNIVHRDIKPANLMITTKGVVKIADFGISKIAGEHGLTMTGTAVGTPAYCSPEQGRGDKVDARADIYSLGVVFYELLTGRKPFDGTTANALIYQHNYAEPTLITALRAEVPDAYQAVALKCLQKDPAKRYQDAAELVGDLERVRAGSAPMTALMNAFGTGADEAMRRLGIRQRRIWPYITAALVLVAIIAGIVMWTNQQNAEQLTEDREIARLRTNLTVLDRTEAIPQSSRDDLAALATLVKTDDADVVRWNGKLQRITELQQRLARLDDGNLPSATLRLESIADLNHYKEDVGSGGEDVVRWQGRLDAALTTMGTLRTSLGELDQTQVVSTAQSERLTPALTQLTHLAGADDEDVKRWNGRLNISRDRISQLRQQLAVLDVATTVISITNVAALRRDLDALTALVGKDDNQARTWMNALQAREERIANVRKNLSRLDAITGWATIGLQTALAEDLATYVAIADKTDVDALRWQRKVTDSQTRIANLRNGLARLNAPEALTVVQQRQAEEQIIDYAALVSSDDGQLQAWQARLSAEREAQAAMKETLKRFEDANRMTLLELDACTKAVAGLGRLSALTEAQQRLYERRLTEEQQQLNALRLSLRARDGTDVTIDQGLVDDLNLLARLVGEEDDDVKRWRQRVNDYERLHTILASLDRVEPIPAEADKALTAFAAIVGPASIEVKRWRVKLARVAGLRKDLAPLDAVVPLPEDALKKAQALVADVSEQDPQAKAYLAKATRVTELVSALDQSLTGAYILPQTALRQRRDLVALVGTQDEHVATLVTRVTMLNGPGQPAWASSSGRDGFGPWAELTMNGVIQRFRYIPAGEFVMGSPEKESGRDRDETQVHVTLTRSLWLADTETTQGFWHVVAGADDSRFKGLEYPVERVSWDECKAFCVTLSTKKNLTARLPTEAEWEYACRAGVSDPFVSHIGAVTLDKLDTIAWFKGTTATTQGVKRRFGNALGLFDMHGNVWEWCEDRYGTYSPTAAVDPVGREQETRVARGGSWGDPPDRIRAANRLAVRADMRTLYLGFRLAIAVAWPNGQEPSPANAAEQLSETKATAP